jgi:N-acetylmuramoyl-L-alanine amidase
VSASSRRGRFLCLLLLLLLPALLAVERPRGLGDVKEVRHYPYDAYTRVVIELTRPVEAQVKQLAANAGARRPSRLYVDLEGIWVGRDYSEGIPVGDGLLQAVRLGQNTLRTSRVVIDLENYEHHRLMTLRAPHRVVIDVYGPRGGATANPGAAIAPERRLGIASRPVRIVVIDPGHGGKDPGALGVGGLREKTVNLALAKRLATHLQARGFRTVLTRSDDRYLNLEERTALAQNARGDLFVSIHANASPQRKTRGIEIYHLDSDHERHSLDVVARENGVPRGQLDPLQRKMAKLRINDVSDHATRLAQYVHDDVVKGLASHRRTRKVPDLGVKKGPFYVLFLTSMPSILVEAGFLTNREDAKLLRDDRYLDLLADYIANGLVRYREAAAAPAVSAGGAGQ